MHIVGNKNRRTELCNGKEFRGLEILGRVESSVGETVHSVSKTGIFVVNSNGGAEGVVEISEELEESRITSVSEKKLFVTGFSG